MPKLSKLKLGKKVIMGVMMLVLFLIVATIVLYQFKKFRIRMNIIENFDNTDNVIDTIINTANTSQEFMESVFDEITDGEVKMKKDIATTGAISSGGDITADGDITSVNTTASTSLTTPLVKLQSLNITGSGTSITLSSDDLKKLASQKNRGGFAIDGEGTTIDVFEGSWELGSGTMNSWTKDRWDAVYLFKGWQITVYKDASYSGTSKTVSNTTDDIMKVDLSSYGLSNTVSSYKLEWVGY